jgi:hypothetical protein
MWRGIGRPNQSVVLIANKNNAVIHDIGTTQPPRITTVDLKSSEGSAKIKKCPKHGAFATPNTT